MGKKRIGNCTSAEGLYAPSEFHVEGFSAGSHTGAVLVLALRVLFPECHVSATLGAVAMPKGVFGALMEAASPGQYDIHFVHAEEDQERLWSDIDNPCVLCPHGPFLCFRACAAC